MKVLARIREITQRDKYLDLIVEHYEPLSISQISLSRSPPAIVEAFRALIGKDAVFSIEQREYQGRKFWALGSSLPHVFNQVSTARQVA